MENIKKNPTSIIVMSKQFYQIIMNCAMHNLWKRLHVDEEQSLEGLRDETQTSVISVVLKEESKYSLEQVTPVHSEYLRRNLC